MDGSDTINPADLDSSNSLLSHPHSNQRLDAAPRGVKRSRSPDVPNDAPAAEVVNHDEVKPRKRGRPQKNKTLEAAQASIHNAPDQNSTTTQTPHGNSDGVPLGSPSQPSPPKSTPTGKSVKALPTVRDHTTDQLNPEGDEYIPREFDDAGEQKVTLTGHLTEGREYRCRTFLVPNRGNKLFMLATECARVLNYRDSYLLFNKNRSLYKIIASQAEKDDLIHQEILPYSYRSRQIAIVTARSMYRQFGARMIVNGRRVRDDYWETKARKQGFTEDDPASEKRPSTTKKEAPANELTYTNVGALTALANNEFVYRDDANVPSSGPDGYPMLGFSSGDVRFSDYGNITLPRQDVTGVAYEDRTQPSNNNEIVNQAAQAAQFNQNLNRQRTVRSNYLNETWHREHEQKPPSPSKQAAGGEEEQPPPPYRSPPPLPPNQPVPGPNQQPMMPHPQAQAQMMNSQAYQRAVHQQNALQSPVQNMPPQQVRPEHLQQQQQQGPQQQQQQQPQQPQRPPQPHHQQQRGPSYPYGAAQGSPHNAMYGYPQNAMWPQHQQSPHPQQQPGPPYQQPQHSPHPPQYPQQRPGPPQLPHSQSGSMPGAPMGYQGAGNMPQQPQYATLPRMYNANPQQYMQQSSPGQAPGMAGWGPPGSMAGRQPQQQQQQQQQQNQPPQQQQQGGWHGY